VRKKVGFDENFATSIINEAQCDPNSYSATKQVEPPWISSNIGKQWSAENINESGYNYLRLLKVCLAPIRARKHTISGFLSRFTDS
jgi:hypothetical protein